MNKKDVSAVLEQIAVLLELTGENPFKVRSYENGARAIAQLDEDLETVVREGRLRELKGVGEALEKKIVELVTTGRLEFYEKLRARFPRSIFELFGIQSLGPKRIKVVHDELGVDSLETLEAACRDGRVAALKGFSDKLQQKILDGIAFAQRHQGSHLAHVARMAAQAMRGHLAKDKSIVRIEVAGSTRRCKEVVKDIDILVSSGAPEQVMRRFVDGPGVTQVVAHGDTKSSIVLEGGIAADLRVVEDAQFPFALAYFTGSKEHNVVMRQRAKDRGLKLNEYGLFREDGALVACRDEADIFRALDLPYIPPELREDRGEFDAERIPDLIEWEDLLGVIHVHTPYSDGRDSPARMAEAVRKRGGKYLVICDHSQSAAYANGMKPETVLKQHEEIDALNAKFRGFRIVKGIESDIRPNGGLDYDEDILRRFEFVIASVHSKLEMSEDEATARIIKAAENPYTDAIGHPTGRLLLTRTGYSLNYEKVFDACAANRVAIEINSNEHRLDIDWRYIRRGKEKGVRFIISPDAHDTAGLDCIPLGAGIARKGWLEAGDVLNTLTAQDFLAWRKPH
ncbi:MAG: DNA polymerase/3'-5' exonuclease PolX [Candidatus Hydrogenedentes bacterium]|nr:DNA polymerase/3'-5' exonuclease PolX [Candidatus Hydrogenedentota bacterium]